MDISIVIVTYNSDDLIFGCLDSIFINNDIDDKLEIIIVDNKSVYVDRMFAQIKQKYSEKVILIKNKENGGYGQGNNIGIKAATSPIIMIMNPDVRLVSPIFSKVRSYFLDAKLTMLGMKQMISANRVGLSFAIKLNFIPIIGLILTVLCNKLQLYIPSLMHIAGAAFFIRKSTFESIGLFDEQIFLYGEENDVHYRLVNSCKHVKFKYCPKIEYIHLIEDRPLSDKYFSQIMKSTLYFCEKNNLNKKHIIKTKIIDEKFWILIEMIRNNKDKKNHHKLCLSHLKQMNYFF